MLVRCEVCEKFGEAYGITPEPHRGSVNIGWEEVPEDLQKYIESLITRLRDSY